MQLALKLGQKFAKKLRSSHPSLSVCNVAANQASKRTHEAMPGTRESQESLE